MSDTVITPKLSYFEALTLRDLIEAALKSETILDEAFGGDEDQFKACKKGFKKLQQEIKSATTKGGK